MIDSNQVAIELQVPGLGQAQSYRLEGAVTLIQQHNIRSDKRTDFKNQLKINMPEEKKSNSYKTNTKCDGKNYSK